MLADLSRLVRWTCRDSALLLSGPYKERSRGPQDWAENLSDLTSHKTSDATLLRLCSCLSVGVLVGKPRDFASAACSCGRSCVCNCIWRVAKGLSSAVCSYGDCREGLISLKRSCRSMFLTGELDRTGRKRNENNFCPSHRPRGTNILAARSRRGSSVAVPVGFYRWSLSDHLDRLRHACSACILHGAFLDYIMAQLPDRQDSAAQRPKGKPSRSQAAEEAVEQARQTPVKVARGWAG